MLLLGTKIGQMERRLSPSKVTTHGPEIIASLWSLISVAQRLNKHQVGVDVL